VAVAGVYKAIIHSFVHTYVAQNPPTTSEFALATNPIAQWSELEKF